MPKRPVARLFSMLVLLCTSIGVSAQDAAAKPSPNLAGLAHVAYLLVLTALSGGVMAVGLALIRGRLQQTIANVAALASHHTSEGLRPHPELNLTNAQTLRLPYALAIAGGSILTLYFQVQ